MKKFVWLVALTIAVSGCVTLFQGPLYKEETFNIGNSYRGEKVRKIKLFSRYDFKEEEEKVQAYKQKMIKKINFYLSQHPKIDSKIKQHLQNIEIACDMDKEQVILLLEEWDYSFYKTKEFEADEVLKIKPFDNYYFYFKNNILILIGCRTTWTGKPYAL